MDKRFRFVLVYLPALPALLHIATFVGTGVTQTPVLNFFGEPIIENAIRVEIIFYGILLVLHGSFLPIHGYFLNNYWNYYRRTNSGEKLLQTLREDEEQKRKYCEKHNNFVEFTRERDFTTLG